MLLVLLYLSLHIPQGHVNRGFGPRHIVADVVHVFVDPQRFPRVPVDYLP